MTPVSSILCPVDFSEGSRAALCYAAALADHFGARLTVITVDDPLLAKAAAVEMLDPPLAVQSEAELRRFSDDVLPHLGARATMLDFRVATGKPAAEILRAVQATKAGGRAFMAAAEQAAVAFLPRIRERVLGTADAAEGVRSFIERRAGRFTGS